MGRSNSPEHIPTYGRERPLVYDWVGEPVFLRHVEGPTEFDKNEPYKLLRGQLEAKTGIYALREVSALGVVVRRVKGRIEGEPDLLPSVFVPWGAIQSIQGLPKDEDEKKQFEAE